ncbi:MAG: hydrogenase/urease maturation nickel metallochaperone HypA [Desulforhopalus sp.]
MHEFSLAQGLHNQLMDLVDEHRQAKVLKAEIMIGDNAGIVVDSFLFGFDVLARESGVTRGMELVTRTNSGKDLVLLRVELQ